MPKKKLNDPDYHRPRIGIDIMGADTQPHLILEAIASHKWEEEHPPEITIYGTKDVFEKVSSHPDLHYRVAQEFVAMDEDPLLAVRKKKNSSIALGIHNLKHFEVDAFITAGNSGAVLAQATIDLNSLPGIDRAAFLTNIPTKSEPIAVLDVGANVNVKAETLLQFAKMGIAYQKAKGTIHPTVGLLNVGEEKQKGTPELRKAYELLRSLNKDCPIDSPTFIGNVEGRDVFRGGIDVLVTDGFTGNVFLKTSQGIAGFVLDQMQSLQALEAIPKIRSILTALRKKLHFTEYPGAILCGIDGIVMKCHGASPPETFIHTITSASRLSRNSFIEKLKKELQG